MSTLQVGVMLESVQLSDIIGIDILGSISSDYIKAAAAFGSPIHLLSSAPTIKFHYISSSLSPGTMTPGIQFMPTTTYDDAPCDLDILIIGGPLLGHRPEAADKFMKEAFPKTKIVMTTCVGSLWLASAGVLEGLKCTTNRGALGAARTMYPGTEWVDQKWVVDGKVWSSGGAFAGELFFLPWIEMEDGLLMWCGGRRGHVCGVY
jgi:transcriptional regulator GlxA family with amidase domain